MDEPVRKEDDYESGLRKKWLDNLKMLTQFKKKFNRWPNQKEIWNDVKIGQWVSVQRMNNAKGNLPSWRKRLLSSIDFPWSCKSDWWQSFEEYKEWCVRNRATPSIYARKPDERKAARWRQSQFNSHRQGYIKEDQLAALNSINFFESDLDKNWNEKCSELESFINVNGHQPTRYGKTEKERELANWRYFNSKLFRLGKLEDDRITRFKPLMESDEKSDVQWKSQYNAAQKFIAENGRLPRAHSSDPKEKALGKWRLLQLEHSNNEKLSKERTQLLQSLNIDKDLITLQWEEKFTQFQSFIANYKELPQYRGSRENESSLYMWIASQRKAFRSDKLAEKRKAALVNTYSDLFENSTSKTWDQWYNEVVSFVKKEKRFPKHAYENADECSLYNWLIRQNNKIKINALSEERLELIDALRKKVRKKEPDMLLAV
jgi:hypothetical protein